MIVTVSITQRTVIVAYNTAICYSENATQIVIVTVGITQRTDCNYYVTQLRMIRYGIIIHSRIENYGDYRTKIEMKRILSAGL